MKKKQIGALILAVVLFIVTGVVSVFTNAAAKNMFTTGVTEAFTESEDYDFPMEDYIAVVSVEGVIQGQVDDVFSSQEGYLHTTTMEYINELIEDPFNRGIFLYIDSPGGNVYETDELYLKLMEYKKLTERPIYCYMSHYAASGGYYAAMAADKIYANRNTVTGSIGVIMSGADLNGLYEKLGIKYHSITSGVNKDSSQFTDEQIAIYQSQVDNAFDQFVSVVCAGRNMSEEQVRTLADGRTYDAKQALENGLIDEISEYEKVLRDIANETGVGYFYELEQEPSILDSFFAKVETLIPKSESQVLEELSNEHKNGGMMYYAK